MGSSHKSSAKHQFLDQYDIQSPIAINSVLHLKHKLTSQHYTIKQFAFGDSKQFEKMKAHLEELKDKLKGCKHIIEMQDYFCLQEDQLCSKFYEIYVLCGFPQNNLELEIDFRKKNHLKFEEAELWSIMASCTLSLAHLQKNQIPHSTLQLSTIFISKQGTIQLSDPALQQNQTNFSQALFVLNSSQLYLSPEELVCLQNRSQNSTNPYKSDIWVLSMIILKLGLLNDLDSCYRGNEIHWETLRYNLDKFKMRYSKDLTNLLEFTLTSELTDRPDCIQLEKHVTLNFSNGQTFFESISEQQEESISQSLQAQTDNNIKCQILALQQYLSNNPETENPSKVSCIETMRFSSHLSPYDNASKNKLIHNFIQGESFEISDRPNNHKSIMGDSHTDEDVTESDCVTENFKMGSKYIGQMRNGMRHGKGKFYYQDGAYYDGEWTQDKMQGFGKLYYQSGKLAYEGYWKDSMFMGHGVLYNQLAQPLIGEFDCNDLEQIGPYWIKYQGQFENDSKSGKGRIYLSNGQLFQGNFIDDEVEGPGIFFTKIGKQISGNWHSNIKIQ